MGTKDPSAWAPQPAVAWMGPTGVGKSALALAVARATGAHVVNCDSVQCYRGFDIGSAKATDAERREVTHHLLDVADAALGEAVDAHRWASLARAVLGELAQARTPALVCGGTGLYVRALRDGLVAVAHDASLRQAWLAREASEPGRVFAELAAVDPVSAAQIGPANPARLMRALEISILSGEPASTVWRRHQQTRQPFALVVVALDAPAEWLRPRLQARAQAMVAAGLVDEVAGLLARGAPAACGPMRAVGYKEAQAVLAGELAPADLAHAIAARSWQYVRRQRTWLRKEAVAAWLSAPQLLACSPQEQAARCIEAVHRAQKAHAKQVAPAHQPA